MAAGAAGLTQRLHARRRSTRLNGLGDRLRDRLNAFAAEHDLEFCRDRLRLDRRAALHARARCRRVTDVPAAPGAARAAAPAHARARLLVRAARLRRALAAARRARHRRVRGGGRGVPRHRRVSVNESRQLRHSSRKDTFGRAREQIDERNFVLLVPGAAHAQSPPCLRPLRSSCTARRPVRARRDVERRRQPGLRRRRERRRDLHERLRRALQSWRHGSRPHRLDGPVRVGGLDELAVDAARGLDRPGSLLPRPARVDGVGRLAVAGADAMGTTNLASTGGKVALVRDAAELTCGAAAGSCASDSLDRGSRRLRLCNRLRGVRPCAGAQQHDRCATHRAAAAATRTRTRTTSPPSRPLRGTVFHRQPPARAGRCRVHR